MSGGSYEYLYVKCADEILTSSRMLRLMQDRLSGLPYAQLAAQETQEIIEECERFNQSVNHRLGRIAPVWKAVEWWDSCDSGESEVKKAMKEFLGRMKPALSRTPAPLPPPERPFTWLGD
jgi:hypothetical protein